MCTGSQIHISISNRSSKDKKVTALKAQQDISGDKAKIKEDKDPLAPRKHQERQSGGGATRAASKQWLLFVVDRSGDQQGRAEVQGATSDICVPFTNGCKLGDKCIDHRPKSNRMCVDFQDTEHGCER